jgi:hypothetical protein
MPLIGVKIGREELIESERERFGVELTSITEMARGTKTEEVLGSTRIALETTTLGEAMRAAIELVVEEKTFDASVLLWAETQIDVVMEAETISLISTDLMISNGRRLYS